MNPTLVLLAAGMSTRYGRLKQLEPVGPDGEALLDFAVFDAHRAGFSRIVLIIREELEEAFREHVSGRWPRELEVSFHYQRVDDLPGMDTGLRRSEAFRERLEARRKPWGTAHAVLTARSRLPGPFVLLNADDFYGEEAFREGRDFFRELGEAGPGPVPTMGLVTYTLRDTLSAHGGVSRGVCRFSPDGWLEAIQEALEVREGEGEIRGRSVSGEGLELAGDEAISTNFWLLDASTFPVLERGFRGFVDEVLSTPLPHQPEFLIPTVVNEAVEAGEIRVRGIPTRARFLGITHPEDRDWVVKGLEDLTEAGRYPSPLWG